MTAPLTPQIVRSVYRALLGRDVESESVLAAQMANGDIETLVGAIIRSTEHQIRTYADNKSRFWGVNTNLDIVGMLLDREEVCRKAVPGHIVNFIGVAMDVKFMPALNLVPGSLDHIPIPANYHSDMAEWAAMLRAVDMAKDMFVCVELGCGWGMCLNNTGTLAKRRGLSVSLIGIEGDASYVEFANQTLAVNGFVPHEYVIHLGIAAADNGVAYFPRQSVPGSNWGLEPIFVKDGESEREYPDTKDYVALPMVALGNAIANIPRVDLLHMDIQGGESEMIRDCIGLMTSKLAYCIIGTHSRQIEGDVMARMLDAGWFLEIERPAVTDLCDGKPVTRIDGVQAWRNPKLLPVNAA